MPTDVKSIVLTRSERRLLKRIPPKGRSDLTREKVYPLIHAGVVSVDDQTGDSVLYFRNLTGTRYLSYWRSERFRFWFPIIISNIALIRSFWPNITEAAAELVKRLAQ